MRPRKSWRMNEQNLVRVNDILSELTKQLGPLERQAETARVYLKKKEELKTCDVNMFLMEMERIKSQRIWMKTEEKALCVRRGDPGDEIRL